MTIAQIVQDTWIQPEDIVAALKEMAVLEPMTISESKALLIKDKLHAWATTHAASLESPVNAHAFSNAVEDDDNDMEPEDL